MRIDFTLTLPGLSEVIAIQNLAKQYGVDILAKVIFSFSPNIVMSPLALPRHLLEKKLDELIPQTQSALKDVLVQLKSRPTFQEQWPQEWEQGLVRGKRHLLHLEKIRNDTYTMSDILAKDPELHEWWQNIRSD
jgi:hypothetical protein